MRIERAPYTTTLYLWKGISAMFYSSFITPFHSHNTLQLIFTMRKQFRFRTRNDGWNHYKTLIIKENVIHRLDTDGGVQLIVYVDATSEMARFIHARYLAHRDFYSPDETTLHRLRPGELEQCLLEPDKDDFENLVHRLLDLLIDGTATIGEDDRVTKVIHLLGTTPGEESSICSLAESVYLSKSRLRSLFRCTTGISLHKYIIIKKIALAIGMIMNGATVAEAAAGSGFSDSSHLHRMILRLFGISPSQFIRANAQKHILRSPDSPLRLVTHQYDDRTWDVERVITR
ncbi:MAG TPA: AraC family transcriptional regulator [Puia sp.]|jgi:AraC-like DNA-binding protein|nr:AraC family transcriptional regulator [Puia sp.]